MMWEVDVGSQGSHTSSWAGSYVGGEAPGSEASPPSQIRVAPLLLLLLLLLLLPPPPPPPPPPLLLMLLLTMR